MRHQRWRTVGRGDEGLSLIESMLAVTILGITSAGLMWGLLAFVIESNRTDQGASANLVLIQFTEALRVRAPYFGEPCPRPPDADSTPYDATDTNLNAWGVAPLPVGWDASAIEVELLRYWDADASAFVVLPTTDSAEDLIQCSELVASRLQEIEVRVTSPDGRATASMAVVKRGGGS